MNPISHLRLRIVCDAGLRDLLLAELGELGYEGFLESDEGLEAWTGPDNWSDMAIRQLAEKYRDLGFRSWETEQVPGRNWNDEWERNFTPLELAGGLYVRASFHAPRPAAAMEIVVDPRMAFGTGHHETTRMMLEAMHVLDLRGRHVLDVGTGTGILAILALKSGAVFADVTDIDPWSIDNCKANFALNGLDNYRIHRGMLQNLTFPAAFDLVLANINKNVLLAEMPLLAARMAGNGRLLLSGFYVDDVPELAESARQTGLETVSSREFNRWCCLQLRFAGR
jgi:ribosomal protein L11 methyltransferase